jgi:hypothetical protein
MKRFYISKIIVHRVVYTTLIALLSVVGVGTKVFALDEQFYSGNDILYYDPDGTLCASPSGSSTVITGNDNSEIIFKYLTGKGLTGEQAAGILGNLQQESGFNPAKIQGGAIAPDDYTPVNGVGFGLAQWTFNSRQRPLVDLGKLSGRKITDLQLQMDFLWQELTGPYASALSNLKNETTPERAAYVFHRDYEGSADSEAFVLQVRGGNAKTLFEKYKSFTPTTVSSNGSCGGGSTNANFTTSFTYYNQCDTPWGNLTNTSGVRSCLVGCGPTSVAMAVTNLTGQKVTPSDTYKYASDNNLWLPGSGGTGFEDVATIARHYGLKSSVMANYNDINAIRAVLDSGGLVMLAGQGPVPFVPAPQAHFVLIRAITATGKFKIADPYPKVANENDQEWDAQQIISSSFGGVQFNK